jgi:hypothetical protein
MSPGYECEHQSTKLKRQKKQDKSVARNTTFLECAFNMANIFMGVRMLGLPYVFTSAGWVGGGVLCHNLLLFHHLAKIDSYWKTIEWEQSETSYYFDDSPYKTPLHLGSAPGALMLPPINSFPDIV